MDKKVEKDTSVLRGLKEKRDKLVKELIPKVYPTSQIQYGDTTVPDYIISVATHVRNEIVDRRLSPVEVGPKLLELGDTLSEIELEENRLKTMYCPVCGADLGNPLTKQANEDRPIHMQYGHYNGPVILGNAEYTITLNIIPTVHEGSAPFVCVKCLARKLLERYS